MNFLTIFLFIKIYLNKSDSDLWKYYIQPSESFKDEYEIVETQLRFKKPKDVEDPIPSNSFMNMDND